MRKGNFAIAKSFIDEGNSEIDKLFANMITEGKKVVGDSVHYVATSCMFDDQGTFDFVIGYKAGKFEAFPAEEELPEGYLPMNLKGGTFKCNDLSSSMSKAASAYGQKTGDAQKMTDKLFDVINDGKKTVEGLAESIDYKTLKYPALLKFAKDNKFNPKDFPDKKKQTLIKYLDVIFQPIKNPGKTNLDDLRKAVEEAQSKIDPENDNVTEVKAYKVVIADMVKNQSGLIAVGAIINDQMEFEDSFENMLKAGWIEEIEDTE